MSDSFAVGLRLHVGALHLERDVRPTKFLVLFDERRSLLCGLFKPTVHVVAGDVRRDDCANPRGVVVDELALELHVDEFQNAARHDDNFVAFDLRVDDFGAALDADARLKLIVSAVKNFFTRRTSRRKFCRLYHTAKKKSAAFNGRQKIFSSANAKAPALGEGFVDFNIGRNDET